MSENINNIPDLVPTNWPPRKSRIKVIGVGGGGGNAVSHMFRTGIKEVEFVVCNTDEQALRISPVPLKIQLGEVLTKGLGTGCSPEQGRQAAEESEDKIRELLSDNTEMVFITAGMGGGTGTGAAPVIAKMAKEKDILTVGIVTLPFRHEGIKTLQRACDGILELQQQVDSLLIVDNEKLCEIYGDLPTNEAFEKADDVLSVAAKGIAEIITLPGHINVDLADVKMVMKNSGVALMGAGKASGEQRAFEAVEQALHSPLLNANDVAGARNVLVNITTARNNCIKLSELTQVVQYVYEKAGRIENCKHGIVYDDSMGDAVSITVVATGFSMHAINMPILAPETRKIITLGEEAATDTVTEEPLTGEQSLSESDMTVNTCRRIYTIEPEKTPSPATHHHAAAMQTGRPALIVENNTDISKLEKEPAYLRRKMPLAPPATPANTYTGTATRIVTENNTHRLSTNNTFLYQTQD